MYIYIYFYIFTFSFAHLIFSSMISSNLLLRFSRVPGRLGICELQLAVSRGCQAVELSSGVATWDMVSDA